MACPCRFPLIFTDRRDGEDIEYISVPTEDFEDMGVVGCPKFEEVEEEGFDEHMHTYMAVMWKDPVNATTKRYDVNDHIVIAGCEAKVIDGKKIQCRKKELYVVLHPIDEWNKYHLVNLKNNK